LWGGRVAGLAHGEQYKFYVVGPEGGEEGLKRDPYARDLTDDPGWPDCQCLLSDPGRFAWHDAGYRPPPFSTSW
jgi:1,4-alpha-glucan branching enzyme